MSRGGKMPKSLDDIISELEFLGLGTSTKSSVQASDGIIVELDKTLWESSPVLRGHSTASTSFLRVSIPGSSLRALLNAHRNEVLPRDPGTLWDLLAVTHQLELEALRSKCFRALCETEAFGELDFPLACSGETVMQCFKVLLDCPLRTADIYKQQLERIGKHCGKDQYVMTNVVNLLRERVEKYLGLDLDGIPLGFDTRKVSLVIRERRGELRTELFDGKKLIHVNLFGKYFDFESIGHSRVFFLKYGSYVLHESGGRVYRKSIRDKGDSVEVLNNCTLVQAKLDLVIAVRREGNRDSLWLWVDDERFERKLRTRHRIEAVDFDCEAGILAVARQSDSVVFYELENRILVPLRDGRLQTMEYCVKVLKSQKFRSLRKQIAVDRQLKLHWLLKAYRAVESSVFPRSKLVLGRGCSARALGRRFSQLLKCDACEFIRALRAVNHVDGGSLLLINGGLYLAGGFPSLTVKKTILTEGSCHSLIELLLSF